MCEVDENEIYCNVIKALRELDGGCGATAVEIRCFVMENMEDIDLAEMELACYVKKALKRGIEVKVLRRTNCDGKYHIVDPPPIPPPICESECEEEEQECDECPKAKKNVCPPKGKCPPKCPAKCCPPPAKRRC